MISERRYDGRVEWPNGARLAVLFTFDFQAEEGVKPHPNGHINYKELTERRYGGTCGIWRVLRIMEQYRIPCTFCVCGATAEQYPDAVREIAKRGHEIAAHGLHHESLEQLNPEEEAGIIEKSIAAILDSYREGLAVRCDQPACDDSLPRTFSSRGKKSASGSSTRALLLSIIFFNSGSAIVAMTMANPFESPISRLISSTTALAFSTVSTNGMVLVRKCSAGNCASRLCPRVSEVIAVPLDKK